MDDDRNDDEVMDEFVVMSGNVAVDLMLDDVMKNDDKVEKMMTMMTKVDDAMTMLQWKTV